MIKFKDLLKDLDSYKKLRLEQAETDGIPTKWNELENSKKEKFNNYMHAVHYNYIQNSLKTSDIKYTEERGVKFNDATKFSSGIIYAYEKHPDGFRSKWKFAPSDVEGLAVRARINDPDSGAIKIINKKDPPEEEDWIKLITDIWHESGWGKAAIVVVAGFCMVMASVFLSKIGTLLKFSKSTIKTMVKYSKLAGKYIAEMGRYLVTRPGANRKKSAFDDIMDQFRIAVDKAINAKRNKSNQTQNALQYLKKAIAYLESPAVLKANRFYFNGEILKQFKNKKITAETLLKNYSSKTAAKNQDVINNYIKNNGGIEAWKAAI